MSKHVILVVDDEEAQRKVLAGFLRKRGYETVTASSVDEAVEVARSRIIDMVLTDLRMPGRDGIELLQELRALNPEIPVIVITVRTEGLVEGIWPQVKQLAGYLLKPFTVQELRDIVGRALEMPLSFDKLNEISS